MSIASTTKSRLFASSLAILLAAPAFRAASADEVQTTTRVVSLAGLDLATEAGQATLRHRVEVAASNVCRQDGETFGGDAYETCRKAAFKDAWGQAQTRIASAISRSDFALAGRPVSVPPDALVASATPPTR